ncbi:MAG: alcohol dehydrogenase catalytic domain-containing protein [Nocardioides sp.]|uniref:zinc-binding dehydrogenase n=1 Tax=Nocardioides sp. TaxID=35761 RepID=UPI0039E26AC8
MKASIVEAQGKDFVVRDVAIAEPVGREVLIDVKAAGLCHSDHSIATMGLGYEFPIVLGHELSGVVSAIGPGVSDVKVGDRVVASLLQFCTTCVQCLSGNTHRCLNNEATLRTAGQPSRLSSDGEAITQMNGLGGFAEQALVHENQVAVVPPEMPFAPAALIGCGVLTGAGAVLNTAKVQVGETVVVVGAGGVGLNAVSGAVIAGAATIIVVDVEDEKLERARAFGATHVINSLITDPVAEVHRITGVGAEHVFDFVGLTPVTAQCVEMLTRGGGLYLIGLGASGAALSLENVTMITRQIHVHGVWMGSSNLKRDIPLYASLYLQGRMNLDGLITREISLSEINEGYGELRDSMTARMVVTDFS